MSKVIKKKVVQIRAILHLLGKEYKSKGTTVEEVINKLNPPVAKGVGILRLERGNKKKEDYLYREKILNGRTINRIFGERSPTFKAISMKNITILFEDFNDKR